MSAPTVPPWLDHLRVDRRGIPVPFINMWGGEADARMGIMFDREVGREVVIVDDSAAQVPDFTVQNMSRQRKCVISGLCQVCARPIPWSRRFLVFAALSVERITMGGRAMLVITEPWLDERCATFALERCPALIRRTRDEHLDLLPITSVLDVQIVLSEGWIEGEYEAYTRAHPVVMWAKIHVPGTLAAETRRCPS